MYAKEGTKGLLKGNFINCAGSAPYTALEFYLYEVFKNNLFSNIEYHDLTLKHKLMCGASAGVFAQVLLNPWDVVKTHYTIEQNTSKNGRSNYLEMTARLYRNEGIRSFYKGTLTSMISAAALIGVRQSLYDFQTNTLVKQLFAGQQTTPFSFIFNTISGGTSGLVAISICYPFDVMRKRMQLNRS